MADGTQTGHTVEIAMIFTIIMVAAKNIINATEIEINIQTTNYYK